MFLKFIGAEYLWLLFVRQWRLAMFDVEEEPTMILYFSLRRLIKPKTFHPKYKLKQQKLVFTTILKRQNSWHTTIQMISPSNITTSEKLLKEVQNFKYLGGWVASSEQDFEIRKALAWSACNKMKTYGSTRWIGRSKCNSSGPHQYLQPISQIIREKRMRLAGHCIRHTTKMAHNLVLWEPTRGKINRGRQTVTYINCLKEDTCLTNTDEIRTAMMARNEWKKLGRVGARPE